jgi:hypothetical protein
MVEDWQTGAFFFEMLVLVFGSLLCVLAAV